MTQPISCSCADSCCGRFARLFRRLEAAREGAFVPFVNLCDPTPDASLEILETLAANGADALELGIPFSDPCADGPVIAASAHRALQAGSTTAKCLEVVSRFRAKHPDTPISLMLYINLAFAPGLEKFFADCAAAGADAVLIADLPASMRDVVREFDAAAAKAGIELISLVSPSATPEHVRKIAPHAQGYTYLLSRAGITGTDKAAGTPAHEVLAILREEGAAPGLLGFGVSTPEHVRKALASGAAGVIVGSAIVRIITEHVNDMASLKDSLGAYVRSMKDATR